MRDSIGRTCAWVLLFTLGIAPSVTAAGPRPDATAIQQDDKSEKERKKQEEERKKQEEKAGQKDLRDSKESKDILDEIQSDLDLLAIEEVSRTYDDRFLQDYVNQLGQSLVPKETPSGTLFSFRVVNDWQPNAFALPDGRIYVTAGLLAFVQNEAQLAVVLGHEIGHVIQGHYVESVKASRSFTKAVMPGLLGALGGALVGGAVKGKEGAAVGAVIGLGAGAIYSVVTMNSYNRKQEDEADRMGVTLAMNRGFDPRESVGFFKKLTDEYGEQDRLKTLLWANHSRNLDRIKTVNALLDTQLASAYNSARTAGNLTVGSGQLTLYISRMVRDISILAMNEDRYRLAKTWLDPVVEYRARDPKTLWAIGRVYKTVGRTEADQAKALDYLQRAATIDERNMYPYILRDLGLMQARLGTNQMPAAVESLKKYVRLNIDKYGRYPSDIDEMYDYLLIFGDGKWTAPKLDPVMIRASNLADDQPTAAPEAPKAQPKVSAPAKALAPVLAPKKKPGGDQ
jgi:predicted Zn-dependent protease